MNQMQGTIDINFSVRGTKGTAVMRFASRRPTVKGMFETHEWSLKMEDGQWVDLLDGADPFKSLLGEDSLDNIDEEDEMTRGFRQQGAHNR